MIQHYLHRDAELAQYAMAFQIILLSYGKSLKAWINSLHPEVDIHKDALAMMETTFISVKNVFPFNLHFLLNLQKNVLKSLIVD